MSQISFYVASRCEKAGRKANQDAVLVCPDVANLPDDAFTASIDLGTLYNQPAAGTLLVVADGMGGMNAGEKASELVINGIVNAFSRVTEKEISNTTAATRFMVEAVVHADTKIKEYARQHPETRGMGSTVAMVWLLGDNALCLWCGDSRIYRFNPANGIVRLSHDHSYVQSLVDTGKIDPEDAFDHPDTNIITRSLGDSGETVRPDTAIYKIHNGDIFLLCSDGLSGLIPDPQLGDILRANSTSVSSALKAFWETGERQHFTDNCTIILCNIAAGGLPPTSELNGYPDPVPPKRKRVDHQPKEGAAQKQARQNTSFITDAELEAQAQAQAAMQATKDRQKAEAAKKRNWAILAVVCVIIVTCVWIFLPYLYPDKGPTPVNSGRTVVEGTIDPNDGDTHQTPPKSSRPESAPGNRAPANREAKETDHSNAESESSSAVPESFYDNLNHLTRQLGNVNKIIKSGTLTEETKATLEAFVKNVNDLLKEYNKNQYALDQKDGNALMKLNNAAQDADTYIKRTRIGNKPKAPQNGTIRV